MDPCTMITVCVIAALSFGVVERLLWYRRETRLKELEVREIEAKVQLLRIAQAPALPSFVDTTDPVAIDAWTRAQLELAGRDPGRR